MCAETKFDSTCDQNLLFTGFNSGDHTWIIDNNTLIHNILTAKNGEMFESIPFSMCNLRWTIQLYPNGGNLASKGSVMIRLRLLSQSSIHKIKLICSMFDNFTLSCSTYEAMLTTECGWISRVLLLSEWISLNPQYLSITVSIQILKLILNNKYSNLLLSQFKLNNSNTIKSHNKPKIQFKYILSKQTINMFQKSYYGKRFESSIFGNNMWRLVIYPKNWSKDKQLQMYIGLHLCCAPIYTQGITAKYWISCKELKHKKWHKTVEFSYKSPTSGSGKFMTLSDIRSLSNVTFEVNVEILKIIEDIDDRNDNEIHIWDPKQIDYVLRTYVYGDDNMDIMRKDIKGLKRFIDEKDILIQHLKQQMMKQQQIIQLLHDKMTVIENQRNVYGNNLNGKFMQTNQNDNNDINTNVNKTILLVDDIIKQIPKFTL
eukprot:398783_1